MTRQDQGFKLAAVAMAVVMTLVSTPSGLALAGLVETDAVMREDTARSDRARVAGYLLREDVRAHLVRLGVDAEEALARVASLSDDEVQQIAARLDTLPAGQFHEAVIGAAVIIFLVLLFLDLFGVVDIFPFINPINGKAKR